MLSVTREYKEIRAVTDSKWTGTFKCRVPYSESDVTLNRLIPDVLQVNMTVKVRSLSVDKQLSSSVGGE